ncbi:HNH endonuclease signature motif containing protein [Pseudomonas sp. NBRC 111127]|uniref:HNH endonuclease signature motif containing protein n=1 Tax=Pseudomonas sp. NBRC 111127 TaxID=1661042 RepID=UPI0015A758D8|nr:HNH endonuclease signature motif containing protein [Pseudomonas sp. NBRC 111127]
MLTHERLREQLSYDPETGEFRWAVRKQKVKLGSIAGKVKKAGYVEIRIDLVSYQAHRLAWLYMTGKWPQGDIDHINRNPGDNRFENLREASRSQNLCNVGALATSSTGVRGVDLHKASGKYRARIRVSGMRIELGLFATLDEARAAYAAARNTHHGRYAEGAAGELGGI